MSYDRINEPSINYDPENGDYVIQWVNGVPKKVYL